jgi:hypothetical protein
MTGLKPWREVAVPHSDVLRGRFTQAEYAADLTQVQAGRADSIYCDPRAFFERTFITEGMRLLLDAVVRRLAGQGGDPVIQLQTAFGGGKTHTMLAVWHLARAEAPSHELKGIGPILDAAGVPALAPARVAVLDGNAISPSAGRKVSGKLQLRTLWGELAFQLGGAAGYKLVAEADAAGTSPGKHALVELLTANQPCAILIDELVAYHRQFEEGQHHAGGTFDSILSFLQALTEAVKAVPQAVLLASLPESEVEAGSARGRQSLQVLEKLFGRVQAIWKPVSVEESFRIVSQRLFAPITDDEAREAVCRAFHAAYRQHAEALPLAATEDAYLQRLRASYPVHPEVFDRLYEDWSTLQGFQRTRGVLRLMAQALHRLWNAHDTELLIQPGTLPLGEAVVRNDMVGYLATGFDAVLDRDVAGPRSEPALIDQQEMRFGQVQAAQRVARCLFLGGAPASQELTRAGGAGVRGIDRAHVLLGALRPGDAPALYLDALGRLVDRAHHVHESGGRYYMDTRANLRRAMEERRRTFTDADDLLPGLKSRLETALGKGASLPVHIAATGPDVPDQRAVRLVVLGPAAVSSGAAEASETAARDILRTASAGPRHHQNAVLFLAPEAAALARAKDHLRTALAWASIQRDAEQKKLDLAVSQVDQVRVDLAKAEAVVTQAVREAWRLLLVPYQAQPSAPITFERVTLTPTAGKGLAEAAMQALQAEEHVLASWAAVHLQAVLERHYWKAERVHVTLDLLWSDLGKFPYMPRVLSRTAFDQAVRDGAAQGLWGVARRPAAADGKPGEPPSEVSADALTGLTLGAASILLDAQTVLVAPAEARARLDAADAERRRAAEEEARKREEEEARKGGTGPIGVGDTSNGSEAGSGPSGAMGAGGDTGPSGGSIGSGASTGAGGGSGSSAGAGGGGEVIPSPPKVVRYLGRKTYEGTVAASQLSDLLAELGGVVRQAPGGRLRLRLEIEGECEAGFPEHVVRALRENSRVLAVEAELDEV